MKMLFTAANFFALPFKRMSIETSPVTGRTYFIHNDRIVAVATFGEKR